MFRARVVGSCVGGSLAAILVVACTVADEGPSAAPEEECTTCDDAGDEPSGEKDAHGGWRPIKDTGKDAGKQKDAAPSDPPLPPCSKSANVKGFVERQLLGGTFWTYVSASYDPKKPMPLVVALHGAGDNAKSYLTYEWQANVDARGMIVVAPQATNPVSAGYGWIKDDRARILAAIDDARACYAVAPGKIILQGFSLGADMSLFVGLTYAKDYAGIAVASGTLARAETSFAQGVSFLPAAKKLPISLWRGTSDPIVSAEDITDTHDRLTAGGHVVKDHSFKGGHKTTPADALAQYDELLGTTGP